MKEQPRTFTHFRNTNFKGKMKKLQIPQKLVYQKFYVHEKFLGTQNCRRNLSKIYFLKKCKENI